MAKVMVDKNILIVIILVTCLVCVAVSAGISTFLVNSADNTVTGEKGEKGDTGATGATGATGSTGATGATGTNGIDGTDGSAWYSGSGAPSSALGATGDYYLNTETNDIYRKDVTGNWIKQTNLQLNNKAGYDSGWVDISSLAGQKLTLAHNLNTSNVQIQIQGKDASGNIHQKYIGLSSNTVQGWNQTYSETDNYIGLSMAATSDGGYIISGLVIKNLYGQEANVFLLKLDAWGYEDWCQTYDLNYYDEAYAVVQTSDDGYAVTGYSAPTYGDGGVFLMKTDSAGIMEWNTTLGGIEASSYAMIQTSDGGYAITGQKETYVCVIKTSENGTLQWINTYGGNIGYAIIQTSDNGYAVAGREYNSGDYISHGYLVKIDANGAMQWNKTIGVNNTEQYCYAVAYTSDGGYILAGHSYSETDYTSGIYLAKTSADGTMEWNKTYTGEDSRYGYSVVEAASGGYVVGGYAYTYTEDDQCDYILLKTTADGTLEWNNTYNNAQYDRARVMVTASDGGYAIVGYSMNEDDEYYITFLVKTFSNGTLDWSQTYGGSSRQYAYSAVATSDGGYAITGYIRPSVTYNSKVYLIKTSADGTLSWAKDYDLGLESSRGYSVIQTSDGGYAITGVADSMAILLKTDVNGTLQWSKTFSLGEYDTYGYSVRQTSDGGYAIVGYVYTEDYSEDVCLIKTDKNGALQWNKTYGGSGDQVAYSMVLTPNGEYVIAGSTDTETSMSAMLLKVDANGDEKWMKSYNSTDDSYGQSLVAVSDGGYAITGYAYTETSYTADIYLIKTDANGTMQWSQTYGGTASYDYGYSIVNTPEGGYAIAGYTESMVTYSYDFMLVKVSSNGTLQWTKTWDGGESERARAIVASQDGSFVLAGYNSKYQIILYKATVTLEMGLANVATTNNTITVYRGVDDSYWQYVRIQIWKAD
jgi:uncharacterized delta-60 repeat protein